MPRFLRLALVATFVGVPAALGADSGALSRVRPMDPHAVQLLPLALRGSPTVRSLADRVQASDLIVYIRFGSLPEGTSGTTSLLSASSAARFLVVTINPLATERELEASLGHELQHVVEIAEAPWVRDDLALRALLARIGWRSGPDKWETLAAVDAGRRVTRELGRRDATEVAGD